MLLMLLSENSISSILAAIPVTIAAIAALVVSIKTKTKADQILTTTNGNLSRLTAALELANRKIEADARLMNEMKSNKAELKEVRDKTGNP